MKKRKSALAGLASAALVFAPVAGAEVPGLDPFVGTWQKHEERLVIDSAGTGVDAYPDFTTCPSCSSGDAPPGTLTFTFTSVTNGVASGTVTASSDAKNHAVGESVTAMLAHGSPGQLLALTIGGVEQLPFCDPTAEAKGQCGA
ncbi:MAG: hypothetical protein ACRDTV_16050 [Mycobacterium sp.]